MGLRESCKYRAVLVLMLTARAACADPASAVSNVNSIAADAGPATPQFLENSGATIGRINIDNASIFDLDDPEENKLLYRFANRAHVTTRPDVIKAQLLFETGEKLSVQRLEESERLLRKNRYLQEASITPFVADDGTVEVNVETSDVWTLMPKISLSRSGGENRSSLGIKEMNLLGTGIALELSYKSNVDRDSSVLKLDNRNIGTSRYAVTTYLEDSSDGYGRYLRVGKPFYSLDSRRSNGFSLLDDQRTESLYARGERVSDYRHTSRKYDIHFGWSSGLREGWTKRISTGLAFDKHEFAAAPESDTPSIIVPDDRRLVYPFVGVELLQDKFDKTSNYDQMGRTEDRFLGTRVTAKLGFASVGTGSDRNAWIFNTDAQTGFGDSDKQSVVIAAGISGRIEMGKLSNTMLDLAATYYRRQSDHRLLYVGLEGRFGKNLDLDNQLVLGGDTGLRGYPLRYQSGDRRTVFTIEQRFFSDWYPFRLFHVGGAVFADAGRAWGFNPVSDRANRWLRDVGFGLRLGNSRSGFGRVAHIDVAFPLDGDQDISNVQFLVSTRKSF